MRKCALIVIIVMVWESGSGRSQKLVRQSVFINICEDRPCGFDRFELECVDCLRSFEDIQREMGRGSAGYDFILTVRRRHEVVFHMAVRAAPGDSGRAGEAVRAGVLDQKSKSKEKYD